MAIEEEAGEVPGGVVAEPAALPTPAADEPPPPPAQRPGAVWPLGMWWFVAVAGRRRDWLF